MFDRVVDAVLIFGFPLGVLVGYMWRDRISRARRARHLAEREAGLNRAAHDAWQLRSSTDGNHLNAPSIGRHHTLAEERAPIVTGRDSTSPQIH
jgi:hypothetical protein